MKGLDLFCDVMCFICFILGKYIYWLLGVKVFEKLRNVVFFMFVGELNIVRDLFFLLVCFNVYMCNVCLDFLFCVFWSIMVVDVIVFF